MYACNVSKITSEKDINEDRPKGNESHQWVLWGYITKRQKMGQYELRSTVEALPLMRQKLMSRQPKRCSHQLAHVVNSMFTTLEIKGILRTATILEQPRKHTNAPDRVLPP